MKLIEALGLVAEEKVRIGGDWGKVVKDPRGMRIRIGGKALTDSEFSGGAKPDATKRPKLAPGDVVDVIERIAPTKATREFNADPGWVKIKTEDGRVGWVEAGCVESVTEH